MGARVGSLVKASRQTSVSIVVRTPRVPSRVVLELEQVIVKGRELLGITC